MSGLLRSLRDSIFGISDAEIIGRGLAHSASQTDRDKALALARKLGLTKNTQRLLIKLGTKQPSLNSIPTASEEVEPSLTNDKGETFVTLKQEDIGVSFTMPYDLFKAELKANKTRDCKDDPRTSLKESLALENLTIFLTSHAGAPKTVVPSEPKSPA